ncbi:hypothetical protein CLG96_02180 [Sphingomonas oleivorans]|uniref:Uncharacterized protein n=1 Tax=Sphingomonas oleivorans TaxID=1735121 RepID=A0A2T5G1E9_9SPHN|nr:hypothetical protein [Sphingomonas oleivorans]PTQ12973.1 hypothetical protein CLG96_02180 [Sphingomonas oleivorans]
MIGFGFSIPEVAARRPPPALWAPTALGMAPFVTATDSSTLTLNSGNVASWSTKGSSGAPLIQTNAAKQPALAGNKTTFAAASQKYMAQRGALTVDTETAALIGETVLPDAHNTSVPGTGFVCTGLAAILDGGGNITGWWATHGGHPAYGAALSSRAPSIIKLSLTYQKLDEIKLSDLGIPIGGGAQGIAIAPDGTIYLAITDGGVGKALHIDPVARALLGWLNFGTSINALAYDGDRDAVILHSASSNNAVTIIDGSTVTLTDGDIRWVAKDTGSWATEHRPAFLPKAGTIGASKDQMCWNPVTHDLYYCYGANGSPGEVYRMDTQTDWYNYIREKKILTESTAMEGFYVYGNRLFANNDKNYHLGGSAKNVISEFQISPCDPYVELGKKFSIVLLGGKATEGSIQYFMSFGEGGSSAQRAGVAISNVNSQASQVRITLRNSVAVGSLLTFTLPVALSTNPMLWFDVDLDALTATLYCNGTLVGTQTFGSGTAGVGLPRLPMVLGSTLNAGNLANYLSGDIQMAGVLVAPPSPANRQKVEGYGAWEYGKVASLPSDHPYKGARP